MSDIVTTCGGCAACDGPIRSTRCPTCIGRGYLLRRDGSASPPRVSCRECGGRGWMWSDGVPASPCPSTNRPLREHLDGHIRAYGLAVVCGRSTGFCTGCLRTADEIAATVSAVRRAPGVRR
jgi:hypothetical protein